MAPSHHLNRCCLNNNDFSGIQLSKFSLELLKNILIYWITTNLKWPPCLSRANVLMIRHISYLVYGIYECALEVKNCCFMYFWNSSESNEKWYIKMHFYHYQICKRIKYWFLFIYVTTHVILPEGYLNWYCEMLSWHQYVIKFAL